MRAQLWLAAALAFLPARAPADAPGSTPGVDCLCPRAPGEALASLRELRNPFEPGTESLERGRALYLGKGFCAVCHGREGRGLGADVDPSRLRGALPRDFTGTDWQSVRSDGELMWVLEHGSPGTAMASFVPAVLTRDEAWLVLLWIRTLGPVPGTAASSR